MSKSTFRHASSRTPRGVISYFGAHHAGKSEKHTPRHAAEKSSHKGCFPGGDVIRLAAGLTAVAATAIGATVVGASIDDNHSKANTSIQRPEGRESTEDTGTLSQPAGLDTFADRPAEEDTIVDGGSYVTSCSLRQQGGWLGKALYVFVLICLFVQAPDQQTNPTVICHHLMLIAESSQHQRKLFSDILFYEKLGAKC